MSGLLTGLGTVVDLELRQRVRSTAWYVLLGVVAALLAAATLLLLVAQGTFSGNREAGRTIFSLIVFFVLLLGSLVTPALSGGAVNSDREAGTLATTQVTRVTTAQLILGKFLAAWAASLAFLVVAVPFLAIAILAGGLSPATVLVSLVVTAVLLGVIAAFGVGFSALIPRTIFSVVVTYLAVAALSIGTLIAFGLGGLADQVKITSTNESYSASAYNAKGDLVHAVCDPPNVYSYRTHRFDRVWWLLAANPYVILGDAVPTTWSKGGQPQDAFGVIRSATRAAQLAPVTRTVQSDCHPSRNTPESPTPRQTVAETKPTWAVGLGIDVALGTLVLLWGGAALRTPARRLPRGSRIA